jgi:hypothetical protein
MKLNQTLCRFYRTNNVARIHRTALLSKWQIDHFAPGRIICKRSHRRGPEPSEGSESVVDMAAECSPARRVTPNPCFPLSSMPSVGAAAFPGISHVSICLGFSHHDPQISCSIPEFHHFDAKKEKIVLPQQAQAWNGLGLGLLEKIKEDMKERQEKKLG